MRTTRRLPSLDLIRGFEAAARQMSFTRAAAELHVTQSAVSRQIKTLEDDLGAKLFTRLNRALKLTSEGEALYVTARSVMRQLEEATARLSARGDDRLLTVTTTVSFARYGWCRGSRGFARCGPASTCGSPPATSSRTSSATASMSRSDSWNRAQHPPVRCH
jgi:DNA-binding transcriptional LysR family regulator